MIKYVSVKEIVKYSESVKSHDDAIKVILNKYNCKWSDNHGIITQTTEDGTGVNVEISLPEDKVNALKYEPVKMKANTSAKKIENIIKYINDKMNNSDILELKITRKGINKIQFFNIVTEIINKLKNKYECITIENGNLLIYKDKQFIINYVNNNFKELKLNIPDPIKTKFKTYQQKALYLYYNIINGKLFDNDKYILIQRLFNTLNIQINQPSIIRNNGVIYGIINNYNDKIEYIKDNNNIYYVPEKNSEFNNYNINYNEIDNIYNKLLAYFN